MIKILHVISDKNIGGAGRLLLNLMACGERERFSFSVVVPKGSMLVPRLRGLSVRVIESDLDFFSLVRVIRREKPHIVHTHAAASARVAARLCGVKVTVNTRHCASYFQPKPSLSKRTAVRAFDTLFTSRTIATAHYVKRVLVGEGIPRGKIVTILNGSCPLRRLSAAQRAEVRRRLGYREDDLLVGMVARLEHGKGQEYFIDAAKLCQKHPKIKFLIAGEGSMAAHLYERAKDLQNLRFLGFLDDVSEIMNVLDVNVNASYISETSSLSLSEGMSVGAIPLVSRVGGNAFMAKVCGVVVPPKDARALARAIIDLSASEHKRQELSNRAVARFFEEFDAAHMTKKTEMLYFGLLSN